MKKLLALLPIAALVLTGCGGSGKQTEAPPALIQPANHETAPATTYRVLAEVPGKNTVYEVNGKNSSGMRFRCYLTDGNTSVAQTCFEYGP